MLQKLILSIFFLGLSAFTYSQPNVELGVSAGYNYYIGDLNPTGHLEPQLMQNAYGIFLRNNFNGRWSWQNRVVIGSVLADDALSDNLFQQNRNLSFQSPIYEYTSVMEFNFFEFSNFNLQERITPYLYGGIGFFWMDPKSSLNGNLYDLRLIGTEGQLEPYSRFQASFPFGFGLKTQPLERLLINFDWGMRRTFTDYIDDVSTTYPDPTQVSSLTASLSNQTIDQVTATNNNWGGQRGNSETNDWFSFIGLSLSFRLTNDPTACHFNPF